MRKTLRLIVLCVSFLSAAPQLLFSYGEGAFDPDSSPDRGAGETAKHALIGAGEVMIANAALLSFSALVIRAGWSLPNSGIIYHNLTSPWIWEQDDGFKINQFGHMYHGSLYFNAGRANGFSFYESALFSALGSVSWELFCENHPACINDFITTVGSSMPFGEMLFRLYGEACAAGAPAPLAAAVSPISALHRLLTGAKPRGRGGNLQRLETRLGMSYAETDSSVLDRGESRGVFSFRGPVAHIGLWTIYGNPFEQESTIPYKHFEFFAAASLDLGNYLSGRFISDGYLFSFSPVYRDTDMMSTGLSLHCDVVSQGIFDGNSTIDLFSNALDWTAKYRHVFSENTALELKLHAGFTFMGVSEYHSPETPSWLEDREGPYPYSHNYGGGINAKLFAMLENTTLGRLELSAFYYTLWTYPGTSALTKGNTQWLFADATYSHMITQHVSLGFTNSFALERGTFSAFPNTRKYNNEIKVFLAWNM